MAIRIRRRDFITLLGSAPIPARGFGVVLRHTPRPRISPSRRITAGKVNHHPFALASFFSKLLDAKQ